MGETGRKSPYKRIPVNLTLEQFKEFILPHLSMPKRGPRCKIGYWKIFSYIIKVLYTGMQWAQLPIEKGPDGKPEIHYTSVYRQFGRWSDDGSWENAFEASVVHLSEQNTLDVSVLHGDGSETVAKKGGAGIGFSGYKHQLGEKVVPIVDRNGYVLAPFTIAPANRNDCILLPESLEHLSRVARNVGFLLKGSILNLDGVFDSKKTENSSSTGA